jgi:hypothetical protein
MSGNQSTSTHTSNQSYAEFIRRKSQLGGEGGFAPLWLPDWLKPFQRHLADWSIRKGRSMIAADCGMGKGPLSLVFAENVVRRTNKPALILCPLAVSHQFVREAEKFGIEAYRSSDGKPRPNITVTNYERLDRFDPDDYSGVVCDEASCIKHWTGHRQKAVTRFLSKMPYRLLCTATPCPNDYVEMGTLSEALGELTYTEMLGVFFRQISDDEKKRLATADDIIHSKRLSWRVIQSFGQWALRAHAFGPFWKWVASWARACRKPSDLGPYDDGEFTLPPLNRRDHTVTPRTAPPGFLFTIPAFGLNQERAERRRTLDERSELAAELTKDADSAVVWCHLNPEGDRLEKEIKGAVQVKGSQHMDEKEELIFAFLSGQARVLVTKPKIAGLGLNLQHCAHVVTFVDHCYDAETELLTADGWKTFDKVQIGDEVGTVNPDSRHFEWQRTTDRVWSPYSGDMIRFAGRSYELIVTPNHRMWSRRSPSRYPASGGRWEVGTAEELEAGFMRQHRDFQAAAAGWVGTGSDVVPIPASDHVNYSKAKTRSIGSIPSDVFASLAGWYLSEGCVLTRDGVIDGQIVICQTDIHPKNRERIIGTLKATGLPVNHETKDIRICNKELAHFLADELGLRSANKRVPRWLKDWPVERLRILWEAVMDGDGMHLDGKLRGLKSISPRLIADFQEIGFKLGIATTDRSANGDYLNIRSECTFPSIVHRPERVPYSGMVGCVSVPNGLLVVRRNGHAIVSGNSYEQFYQCVRRCWRYGQQRPVTLDVIATEGEVNVRRNMERKERLAAQMFESIIGHMNNALSVQAEKATAPAQLPQWLAS